MPAFGDSLMATSQCRGHFKTTGRRVAFGDGRHAEWTEVFIGNPNIASPADVGRGEPVDWISNYGGRRPYINWRETTPQRNCYSSWRTSSGEIYLAPREQEWASRALSGLITAPFLIVGAYTKNDCGGNKNWFLDRWEAVIASCSLPVVQLGTPSERDLAGAIRIHTPTFRLAAAILSKAAGYIGTEGGLHHAAAAFGLPAVVIFGGFVHPKNTGYDFHLNLFRGTEPCGFRTRCDHCRAAMQSITVDEVLTGIHSQIPMPRSAISPGSSRRPTRSLGEIRLTAIEASKSFDFTTVIEQLEVLAGVTGLSHDDEKLLGAAYLAAGRPEHTISVLEPELSRVPKDPERFTLIAMAKRVQRRNAEALDLLESAIRAGDGDPTTYLTQGILLEEDERWIEAVRAYQMASRLSPDDALTRWKEGESLMRIGRFEQGVDGIPFRRASMVFKRYRTRYPIDWWTPTTPTSSRLLIWPADLGIGDMIMYASLICQVAQIYPNTTIACERRLLGIYRRSFPNLSTICEQEIQMLVDGNAFDVQATPRCLLQRFRRDLSQFQPEARVIAIEAKATRDRYQSSDGKHIVGISWFGGRTPLEQEHRCIPIEHWGSLLGEQNVNFISLQYDPISAGLTTYRAFDLRSDLAVASRTFGKTVFCDESIDPVNDPEAHLAQIAACDVVITCDNSVAHFAGGLGVKTLLLLPTLSSWRWQTGRSDTLWYKSVQLVRRIGSEPWDHVLRRAQSALPTLLSDRGSA